MRRESKLIKTSKFLSYVLRHDPSIIGLSLDREGWAKVRELIRCARRRGNELTDELISEVVRQGDKKRFSLSEDGTRIRANYGHSVYMELGMEPSVPPNRLHHGTALRFLPSIRQNGLQSQGREYVHLSGDRLTALKVGQRHGTPVVLEIDSGQMAGDGFEFFLTPGGIWLTRMVPVEYIRFPD